MTLTDPAAVARESAARAAYRAAMASAGDARERLIARAVALAPKDPADPLRRLTTDAAWVGWFEDLSAANAVYDSATRADRAAAWAKAKGRGRAKT